jgi:type VI secretion system protein ImpE
VRAEQLFESGQLSDAIDALGGELRDSPLDTRRRAFLFELLSFAGHHDRAARQLDVLGQSDAMAEGGALLYKSALHADRERRELFESGAFPAGPADAERARAETALAGTLNGRRFESLTDADPRVGARLEVYAAGRYLLLPFAQVASVRADPPRRLRDLLWIPALVQAVHGSQARELGQVLLPAMTPSASSHPDDLVRLGRVTEWVDVDGRDVPVGQKLLLVDGDEVPLLEVRELTIDPPAALES